MKKRNNSNAISNNIKLKLINLVIKSKIKLKSSSNIFGLKLSTAKKIIRNFENQTKKLKAIIKSPIDALDVRFINIDKHYTEKGKSYKNFENILTNEVENTSINNKIKYYTVMKEELAIEIQNNEIILRKLLIILNINLNN